MKKSDVDIKNMRAFTVHPGWAWAICAGVKKQEWRTFLPNPREGVCAVHCSKNLGKGEWEREAELVKKWWGRKLPSREELLANWCGKVVAVVKYAANEADWEEDAYGWRLSGVKKLKTRIVCKGALKLWKMDAALSKKVLSQL